jgi:hypothetical protein
MRTTWSRALLFVCAGTIGCTSRGTEDAGADLGASSASLRTGSGSLAFVRLERTSSLPRGTARLDGHADEGSPRLVANAKVARYSGIDGSAVLKLLGADVRDNESCSLISRLDDFSLAPEARVELLSVGDIALRVGELSQTLSPRLFPDLATTASGWFYAGNADLPLGGPELEEYVLSAQGEHGVGRFETSIAAPGEVQALELAGLSLEREGVLVRAVDAELSWEPEDLRNRVEIEVHAGGSVLSCVARDDGRFVLPQSKLASLEADTDASLVVRRVTVIAADMQGIESAYVRVAATRTLPLLLQ